MAKLSFKNVRNFITAELLIEVLSEPGIIDLKAILLITHTLPVSFD